MPRIAIPVNSKQLQDIINLLESKKTFSTKSALWQAVEDTEWAKKLGLKTATIVNRFNSFGLTCKTKPAEKGSHLTGSTEVKRIPRSEKFATEEIQEAIKRLRKATPARYKPLAVKTGEGSMAAAVKMKCLDCSNFITKEISECPVKACSLWAFRPFQHSQAVEDEENV